MNLYNLLKNDDIFFLKSILFLFFFSIFSFFVWKFVLSTDSYFLSSNISLKQEYNFVLSEQIELDEKKYLDFYEIDYEKIKGNKFNYIVKSSRYNIYKFQNKKHIYSVRFNKVAYLKALRDWERETM
jgi:predicted adenine nucleotide alpha hydrolase (AANH) superfamily ATPase